LNSKSELDFHDDQADQNKTQRSKKSANFFDYQTKIEVNHKEYQKEVTNKNHSCKK
jgi:hypothetical protein